MSILSIRWNTCLRQWLSCSFLAFCHWDWYFKYMLSYRFVNGGGRNTGVPAKCYHRNTAPVSALVAKALYSQFFPQSDDGNSFADMVDPTMLTTIFCSKLMSLSFQRETFVGHFTTVMLGNTDFSCCNPNKFSMKRIKFRSIVL